jgi:hypothetical protein
MRCDANRLLLCALACLAAWDAARAAPATALSIFPGHYTVANERFTDAAAAIARATKLAPQELEVRMCDSAPYPRIVETMDLLKQRYRGQLVPESIRAGVGECPDLAPLPEPPPGVRSRPGR